MSSHTLPALAGTLCTAWREFAKGIHSLSRQPEQWSKLDNMFVVIDVALDNGEIFRVARSIDSDAEQPETIVPELVGLVTEGRFLLLEARDTDGNLRHAVLSARHISRASWQVCKQVATPADEVLWHPVGAPTD